MDNIYEEAGFNSREDYLEYLADMFDIDVQYVVDAASVFGESEDFDGLVTWLEDTF